jgi:hypothetical protein
MRRFVGPDATVLRVLSTAARQRMPRETCEVSGVALQVVSDPDHKIEVTVLTGSRG